MYLQQPSIVTQAKLEVEKTKRVDALAEKFDKIDKLRQKQREDHMQHRREVMKKEADEVNYATVKMHAITKDYEKKIKIRDGRFGNSYAPETLRMAAFGDQIANARVGGSINRK